LKHFQVRIAAEQVKTANMLHVSARFGELGCGFPQPGRGPRVAATSDTD
jgi:hypothetical protein